MSRAFFQKKALPVDCRSQYAPKKSIAETLDFECGDMKNLEKGSG